MLALVIIAYISLFIYLLHVNRYVHKFILRLSDAVHGIQNSC